MTSMNFFYIRNRNRHPVGIGLVGLSNLAVSTSPESSITSGLARLAVSLCAPGDPFDKDVGIRLARERLYLSMVAPKNADPVVARVSLDMVAELTWDELESLIDKAMQRTGVPAKTLQALGITLIDQVGPFLGCVYHAKKDRGVVDA